MDDTFQSNCIVKINQNEHIDHEEHFTQEEMEQGDSTSTRGATPNITDKSEKNDNGPTPSSRGAH